MRMRLQLLSFLLALRCADIAWIPRDRTAAWTSGDPVSSTNWRCRSTASRFCALVRSFLLPLSSINIRRTISGWPSSSSGSIPMMYVFSRLAASGARAVLGGGLSPASSERLRRVASTRGAYTGSAVGARAAVARGSSAPRRTADTAQRRKNMTA